MAYSWLNTVKAVSPGRKKKKKGASSFSKHQASFLRNHIKKPKNNTWGKSMYDPPKRKKKSSSSGSRSSGSSSGSSGSSSGGSRSYGNAGSGGGSRRGGSGGGGKKKKGGRKSGRPPGINMRAANNLVQQDINTQIRALRNQAQGQARARDFDISKLEALFGRTKGDLDYLFDEAKDFTTGQSAKIDQRFDETGASMNQLFNSFKTENQANTNSRRDAASAELARLGIQQSGLGKFDEDAAFAEGMSNTNQANNNANLAAMKFGADEIGQLLQGMATGSHASNVGQANTTKDQGIAQARQDFSQYMKGVTDKATEIQSTKFVKATDLAQQLQAQKFSQFMQMRAAGMRPGIGKGGKKAKRRRAASRRRTLKGYAQTNRTSNALNKSLGSVR